MGTIAEGGSERERLIHRSKEGSKSALGQLLDGYRDYLMVVAKDQIDAVLMPKMSPSDVVQESLLVAARDFREFRGQGQDEMQAWLLKILQARLTDGIRRFAIAEKRRARMEVAHGDSVLSKEADTESATPSELAMHAEQTQQLLQAIESLPSELREVLQLRYHSNLPFAEIADRVQIPVTTVRRRWLEAVEGIKEIMKLE